MGPKFCKLHQRYMSEACKRLATHSKHVVFYAFKCLWCLPYIISCTITRASSKKNIFTCRFLKYQQYLHLRERGSIIVYSYLRGAVLISNAQSQRSASEKCVRKMRTNKNEFNNKRKQLTQELPKKHLLKFWTENINNKHLKVFLTPNTTMARNEKWNYNWVLTCQTIALFCVLWRVNFKLRLKLSFRNNGAQLQDFNEFVNVQFVKERPCIFAERKERVLQVTIYENWRHKWLSNKLIGFHYKSGRFICLKFDKGQRE
jgi:hypothetical protein